MAEPKPPIPRIVIRCPKVVDSPAKKVVTATINKPEVKTTRSPIFSIRYPLIGDAISLVSANIETIVLAANADTPKDLANSGIAGATIPKPSATVNETAAKTQIPPGRSFRLPVAFTLLDNYDFLLLS